MEKKRSIKKLIVILIIIGIIIITAIAIYFLIFSKNSTFTFASPDFSLGAEAMNKVTETGNTNAFENTKLNPFENGTG